MAAVDLDNFLRSLCRFLAAAAGLAAPLKATSDGPSDLWAWQAAEGFAGEPYSVLAVYGGPGSPYPKPTLAVQCKTYGKSNAAAFARAQALFEALHDDDGAGRLTPIRMRQIAGYRAADDQADGHWLLVNVDAVQRPGLAGRDDQRNRVEVAFNFEAGVRHTAG